MTKKYEFVRYIFCTLTYRRDEPDTHLWKRVSSDWNRYIQRIRRLHGVPVGYLRTVEAHEDLYPHLHAILDFRSAAIRVENAKFFDQNLYTAWKNQWSSGYSDYQRPHSGHSSGALLYITKYITKSSASKRIWRELFADVKRPVVVNTSTSPTQKISDKPALHASPQQIQPTSDPTSFFCKQFKIKQCTWSRNFTFPRLPPKSLLVAQSLLTPQGKEPCLYAR